MSKKDQISLPFLAEKSTGSRLFKFSFLSAVSIGKNGAFEGRNLRDKREVFTEKRQRKQSFVEGEKREQKPREKEEENKWLG